MNWWEKQGRFILIGMGIGLIILGGGWMASESRPKTSDVEFYSVQEEESQKKSQKLFVDVRGAVENPGVFELKLDSRLEQAVLKAGGYSDKADLVWVDANLNMARELSDGEKVYIPEKGESRGSQSSTSNVQIERTEDVKSTAIVNLNTAQQSELESLSGIGPAFAERIIDYREANGGFMSKEEIQAVSGIGEKTYEKIKGQIGI